MGGYGKDSTHQLVADTMISGQDSLIFDSDIAEDFVATYISGTAAESYLLQAKVKQSSNVNYTDIKDLVSGSYICQDRKAGDSCTTGSVTLYIENSNYDNNWVNVTSSGNTNIYFDRVVSAEGLQMRIPANMTEKMNNSVVVRFAEEDKDGNIAAGNLFNVTLGLTGTDTKAQVSGATANFSVAPGDTSAMTTYRIGDTDVYSAMVKGELATKLSLDQGPTQDTMAIEYHGGPSYAALYMAAADTVSSSTGNALVFKNSELGDKKTTKNLIVVGGPAVNQVAADLLGLKLGDTTGFTKDQAMVKLYSGKLVAGNLALLDRKSVV